MALKLFGKKNEAAAKGGKPHDDGKAPPDRQALIARMREVCAAAAKGDLEPRITAIPEDDELGELAWEINALLDMTNSFVREAAASMQAASEGRYYRKIILRGMGGEFRRSSKTINDGTEVMHLQAEEIASQRTRREDIARDFERMLRQEIDEVIEAAERMSQESQRLAEMAADTTARSTAVAAATEEATANVQAVASASEELASTIRDVSARASESSRTTSRARNEADQTADRIRHLNESTARIDEVVIFINDIASQTNLLALNATIEAARAGEAGKGFAVVASEVKSLAGQTAKATEEITAQVKGVQEAMDLVVEAMTAINGTIGEIDGISNAIAEAVEQQSAATQEISSNVHQAATGTGEVAQNIVAVSDGARQSGDAAKRLHSTAKDIVKRAGSLREGSDHFLRVVRDR
jgi:methyl-accepting chemotaxis protein